MKLIALDIETLTTNAGEHIELETIKQRSKLRSKLESDIAKIKTKYKKEETQEKHIMDAQEKCTVAEQSISESIEKKLIGNRSFTQIICIGVAWEDKQSSIKHRSFYGSDEAKVIEGFSDWLDDQDDYKIVTFNGDGFDIPQLIAAFSRVKMRLVFPINSRNIIDLMKYPYERFMGHPKLDDVAAVYGIEKPEGQEYQVIDFEDCDLDGSFVADMYKLDLVDPQDRVAKYCNQDTYKTLMIALEIGRFVEIR